MIGVALAAAAIAHLTPDGWGRVTIGMTRAQVERVLGTRLEGEPIEDEESCIELVPPGPDQGIVFMFQSYRLTRISIGKPSAITTPRGIGIGASARTVRKAYGAALKAEKNHYDDLPAEYLTYWTVPAKRGVRFETDQRRTVYTIHAGDSSIQYVEGCA